MKVNERFEPFECRKHMRGNHISQNRHDADPKTHHYRKT